MEVQVADSAKELQEMIDGHWSALKLLTTLKFIAIVSFENMIQLGKMKQLGKETKKYILQCLSSTQANLIDLILMMWTAEGKCLTVQTHLF